MKLFLIIGILLFPTVIHAEECDDSCYIEMKDNNGDYRIIDSSGKEVGIIVNDYYEKPKYMPDMGIKDNTIITIHIPENGDMLD